MSRLSESRPRLLQPTSVPDENRAADTARTTRIHAGRVESRFTRAMFRHPGGQRRVSRSRRKTGTARRGDCATWAGRSFGRIGAIRISGQYGLVGTLRTTDAMQSTSLHSRPNARICRATDRIRTGVSTAETAATCQNCADSPKSKLVDGPQKAVVRSPVRLKASPSARRSDRKKPLQSTFLQTWPLFGLPGRTRDLP